MELPANPARLSVTGYDEYGRPISEEEEKARRKAQQDWHFSDNTEQSSTYYDSSTAFGIEGGSF